MDQFHATLSKKRSFAFIEEDVADMTRAKKAKAKAKAPVDISSLSSSDRQALERVAAIFNKQVPKVYEELSANTSLTPRPQTDVPPPKVSESETILRGPTTTTRPDNMTAWQHVEDGGEVDDYIPFAQSPGFVFASDAINQTEFGALGGGPYTEDRGTLGDSGVGNTETWRHGTDIGLYMNARMQNESSAAGRGSRSSPLHFSEGERDFNDPPITAEEDIFSMEAPNMGATLETGHLAQDYLAVSASNDFLDTNENPSALHDAESDENEQLAVAPGMLGQLGSSASASSSQWSLVEVPQHTESAEKTSPSISHRDGPLRWISNDSTKTLSSPQQQRRGPFSNKLLREETSNTRKLKACVRCRMQKIRCLTNDNDPTGVCRTCQAVSKQKVHTLQCVRYKITESTVYRTGKAPGLEFTFRWPVMKLKDISKWADTEVRTIAVLADICPVPLELSVRRFVPIPQDRTTKSWMDGKVKKWKQTTPYAIVNMSAAAKVMQEHVNANVFICLNFFLEGRDTLIQETFAFARLHMRRAHSENERLLMANFFRLWFGIRRTATTEHLVGDDTLDMTPETLDHSYPFFGKVPLPPVMIQQLDMVLTLGLLQPLQKKVLEEFQRIVLANNPRSWLTIYLITFMFLHSCAALSAENYSNARKHGLKRRYSMPTFISELHHGANVFLSHYHYCTQPCDPFALQWSKRESTPFAEMATDEIHFLIRTSELVKERKDKIRVANQISLYEDDLYFVSQMFEKEWTPRDTPMDYDNSTVAGEPLS